MVVVVVVKSIFRTTLIITTNTTLDTRGGTEQMRSDKCWDGPLDVQRSPRSLGVHHHLDQTSVLLLSHLHAACYLLVYLATTPPRRKRLRLCLFFSPPMPNHERYITCSKYLPTLAVIICRT